MKSFLTGVTLVAALQFSGFAQSSVSGRITDAETGEALAGSSIYIPDLRKGTASAADGSYRLEGLPKGIFRVQYAFLGYETHSANIVLTGEAVVRNAALHPAVMESHEVTVAAGYASGHDENPVKVDQVTAEKLSRSAAPGLAAALAETPGLSSRSTGTGIGKPVIRGLSGNRVVVYSQGVRIENQQWGDEHGMGLNEHGIEKAEIIKGPSSLLYGSDAMGGVIHLIGEKPAEVGTVKGDVSVKTFSNTLGHRSDAGIRGSGKTFRYGLRAGYANHADYRAGPKDSGLLRSNDTTVTNSRFNERTVKASAGYNGSAVSSNVYYTLIHSRTGLPEGIGAQDRKRSPALPMLETSTQIWSAENIVFLGKSKVKVNVGYLVNRLGEFEEEKDSADAEDPALDMRLHTITWDGRWHFHAKETTELIIGVQGMSQQNRNRGEEMLIPDAATHDIGALVLARTDRKKISLQAGLRYDSRRIATQDIVTMQVWSFPSVRNTYGSVNGSVGLSFHPGERIVVRANVASGFRAPNLAELTSYGVHEGTNRFEIGSTALQNEQNYQADLSAHLHTKHTTADVALFYNVIANYIFAGPTGGVMDEHPVFVYTQSDALLYGGEFAVDIHPHPFDWLHAESGVELVVGERADGTALPLIPAARLRNGLRGEFRQWRSLRHPWFGISVVSVTDQSRVAEYETPTPGYLLLNAGLGAELTAGKRKVIISITAQNLLNKQYYDHLSRLKSDGIFNPGRNMMVGLKIPFVVKP